MSDPIKAVASARRCCARRTTALRGRGQFVADIPLRGTHEVVFLRSPHAHAHIRSISVPPAARGRVFTAADLPRIKPIRVVTQAVGARSPPWPPLATATRAAAEVRSIHSNVLRSAGVASPPVDGPWRLIVQCTVNICAIRCKARIIRRDGSTARLSDPTGKLTWRPRDHDPPGLSRGAGP